MENDGEIEAKSEEINMEVGIEDYLNIKMHFPKNIYALNGQWLLRFTLLL